MPQWFVAGGVEPQAIAAEAARLAWEGGCRTLVLPCVPFGANAQQLDLRGTINMHPSTQAAVLAEIAAEVYTIEIVEPLGLEAEERLTRLGYDNVHVRVGDGYAGWPDAAPFDAVIVTAAAPRIPEPLKQQLREGGKMILPVGEQLQELVVLTRQGDDWREESVLPVRFVPMTGEVRR